MSLRPVERQLGVPSHVSVRPSKAIVVPCPQSNENAARVSGRKMRSGRFPPSEVMNIPSPFPYAICLPFAAQDGIETS